MLQENALLPSWSIADHVARYMIHYTMLSNGNCMHCLKINNKLKIG